MISGNSSGSRKDLRKAIRMDFVVKRGDTFSYVYDVTYIDANGVEQIYDLTGCYAQMHLKKKQHDSSYYTAMAVNMDTSAGTITFFKSAIDMKIPAHNYWFDLEIKDAAGKNITWIEGRFKVIQDMTDWILEAKDYLTYTFQYAANIIKSVRHVFVTTLNYTTIIEKQPKHITVTTLNLTYIMQLIKFALLSPVVTLNLVYQILKQMRLVYVTNLNETFIIERYQEQPLLLGIVEEYTVTVISVG